MSTDVTVRPAQAGEVEKITELLNEHSRRLHGTDNTTAAELRQYWESPDIDFPDDILVAEKHDGALVGYADVGVWGEHVWLDLRGLEPDSLQPLLASIEARAAEKKPGANLIGYTEESDQIARDVFDRAGYRVIRHSFRMEIDLDQLPPATALPEGVVVRPMREGEEKQVYEVHEQSFEDAWMHTREPFDQWAHWFVGDPAFDPSLWFVAEADGEIAGVAICRARETEPGLGWVRVLGVLRPHRRRGIGEALLRHAFAEFARRGFERVGLGVDAGSPTGAVRLYEGAGMHVARRSLQLEKVVGP